MLRKRKASGQGLDVRDSALTNKRIVPQMRTRSRDATHADASWTKTLGLRSVAPLMGSLGPLPFFALWNATHADLRVPLLWFCLAVRTLSLRDASPGVLSQTPFVTWSVLGLPPFCSFHHCPVEGYHWPTVPEGRQSAVPPHEGCPLRVCVVSAVVPCP